MDTNILEKGTRPAQNYLDSFFASLPTDLRIVRSELTQIGPFSAIDINSRQIGFQLRPLDSHFCYDLSDTLIKCTVGIRKADGKSVPDKEQQVGPVNNACLSLFKSMTMHINDIPITTNPDHYHYKTYIQQLISFNADSKGAQMYSGGWLNDFVSHYPNTVLDKVPSIEPTPQNNGYNNRVKWFRKNFKEGLEYRDEGFVFCAPFRHELFGLQKLIPPKTKVSFSLERSPDEFYLLKGCKNDGTNGDDKEKYRVVLSNVILYVKKVQLSEPIWLELKHRWDKDTLKYFYRDCAVRVRKFLRGFLRLIFKV